MEILSKITVKNVCGNIDEIAKTNKRPVTLCQIIGMVRSYEEVKGVYGISYRFTGEFKATNLITQEKFFSGSCFLPGLAESLVMGQLEDGTNNALQIAFNIGIRPADNKVGYEYTVKPLIEPAENNPLAMLENKINNPKGITHVDQIDIKF